VGTVQETFRAPAEKEGERGACTAIYFLLAEGQKSHWHKVDAVETWLWHSGAWACIHEPQSKQ
jgi:predicted cupin superfamily sugar epimerase